MSARPGRNQPCPCGSGRKYKHCHNRPATSAPADDPLTAVRRAFDWLNERHRKALQHAIDDLIFAQFWPTDDPDREDVDDDFWQMILVNAHEWLLAAGELSVRGQPVAVTGLLLGPGGPRLGPRQKDFLRQLACCPLRLFEVTNSRPGKSLTLIDALDEHAEPLIVHERSGSESLGPGDLLGARPIWVDDHFQLSGAVYPFTRLYGRPLIESAREFVVMLQQEADDLDTDLNLDLELARFIAEHWFAHIILPPPVPQMMDASTGAPLLLISDYYRVVDREALDRVLADSAELEHVDDELWEWIDEDEHGVGRARLSLAIEREEGRQSERVTLFCRTRQLADEGRSWFEARAGDSVVHLARETIDPAEMVAAEASAAARGDSLRQERAEAQPDVPPAVMSELVAEAVERTYANWADEPLPALGNRSPREAMATTGGLERVKGLLRSYDANEQRLAQEQGRAPVSFQFLWDRLGLQRD